MSKITKLVISLLLVVVVALAFGAGFTFGHRNIYISGEGLDVVGQAWNIILNDFVERDRINTDNLSRAAIEGMVETLNDPYTSYLPAEEYEMGLSSLEGEFTGIGAYVSMEDNQLVIIAPIEGSPAETAGIKAGDVILAINGDAVAEMNLAGAIIKIRGPDGSAVKLLVLHEGETEPVEIEITRGRVAVPSVRLEMMGDIARINIYEFTERTGAELSDALQDMAEKNAEGIILDLRGNPGGLLDTVLDVASHFLRDGVVVAVRDNQGQVTTLNARPVAMVTDLPMVVLVDGASASGSEVLSGALQDRGRATIAGSVTYGKGSVDILRPLSDGSGLYITTARWLTPDGRLIEGQGIEPDIELEITGEEAIQWAIGYLKGNG
jgi:carboxyl-terminal processing protease